MASCCMFTYVKEKTSIFSFFLKENNLLKSYILVERAIVICLIEIGLIKNACIYAQALKTIRNDLFRLYGEIKIPDLP